MNQGYPTGPVVQLAGPLNIDMYSPAIKNLEHHYTDRGCKDKELIRVLKILEKEGFTGSGR